MSDFIPLGPGGGQPQGRGPPGRNHRGGGSRGGWNHPNPGRGGRSNRGGGRGGWNNNYNHRGRGRGRGGGRGRGRGGGGGRHNNNSNYDIGNDIIEELGTPSENSLCIAVEGCCHGELDRIYDRLQAHETKTGQKIDLLLCCGDFQSHRNEADFHSSSIPPKYRSLGTFPKYYAGEKKAPILTLFIGGNHEASQPLRELYYGGWVAPNIYYMGAASVIRFGGLRIGGISGIYKSFDYTQGHFETPPYDNSSLRSVYHVRNVDVYRLKQLAQNQNSRVDIMVSHDWPLGIAHHGDTQGLLRRKPYFRAEVEENSLGSPPNREILDTVQPKWWFAAHLHVKFKATVEHKPQSQLDATTATEDVTCLVPSQISRTTLSSKKYSDKEDPAVNETNESSKEENDNSEPQQGSDNNNNASSGPEPPTTTEFLSVESTAPQCGGPDLTDQMTQFLALDKCLPRRQYLSILHMPSTCPKKEARLEYDAEWLAILRKTHPLSTPDRRRVRVPEEVVECSVEDIEWVKNQLVSATEPSADASSESSGSNLTIPDNFQPTVPFHSHPMFQGRSMPLARMGNPQTDRLLDLLQLDHILTIPYSGDQSEAMIPPHLRQAVMDQPDDNEIDIDMDGDDGNDEVNNDDENEIDIDGEDDDKNEEGCTDANSVSDVKQEMSNSSKSPGPDGDTASSGAAIKKARLD